MYNMNLAASLFKKSKLDSGIIKVLQILNIIFQILIVILLILAFFMSKSAKKYDNNCYVLKKSVSEQRKNYNIDETLKFWQEDTFKLSVIKTQIEKSSVYAIAMKELGNYLPEDDAVYAVAIEGSTMEYILKVAKSHLIVNLKGKDTLVDYSKELKKRFANSICFNKNDINVEMISQNSLKPEGSNTKGIMLFDNEVKNIPQNPNTRLLKVTMKLEKRKVKENEK